MARPDAGAPVRAQGATLQSDNVGQDLVSGPRSDPKMVRGTVSIDGKVIAKIENRQSKSKTPGFGGRAARGPTALSAEVDVTGTDGATIGRWTRQIGLRTIVLDRTPTSGVNRFNSSSTAGPSSPRAPTGFPRTALSPG